MNFYVLMESLYRRYGEPDREPSLRTEPEQEVALFKSDASIAFPGSDLSTLERSESGQFILTTRFLFFRQPVTAARLLPGSNGAGIRAE